MGNRLVLVSLLLILLMITVAEYYICFEPDTADTDKKAAFIVGLVSATTDEDWSDQLQLAIQGAITDVGGEIISLPALRTQEAQINSLRALIVYRVDVIIFSPIIETGWDSVYAEAETAGIPIIALEKSVRITDEKVKVHYVGYDYYQAAADLTQRMLKQCGTDTVIMELFGTLQADSSKRISRGFRDTLDSGGYDALPYTVCCDFMRSRAFQAVDAFLGAQREMDVIISQGDAMTLGAISALEEKGLIAGQDVQIFAVGGSQESVELAERGKITCLMKCDIERIGRLTVQAIQLLLDDKEHAPISFLEEAVMITGGAGDNGLTK